MSPIAAQQTGAAASADSVHVIKSPNDPKEYRHFTLENGIKVLLIHDPEIKMNEEAQKDLPGDEEDEEDDEDEEGMGNGSEDEGSDEEEEDIDGAEEHDDNEGPSMKRKGAEPEAKKKAAASLSVQIGSFADPEDLLGLSHYLEHMLFMGSEKYPKEDDYDAFLTRHGGSSNAYTDVEHTNFHFDVQPAALEGALDRFAQFFIAPLCLEGALDREVNAVDHEFTGVLQSDSCRVAQLRCETARKDHVYAKFTWGNRKSLVTDPAAKGIAVRDRLLDYYRRHYSADRMSLVVLGGQPLPALEALVRQCFGAVPRADQVAVPAYERLPFPFAHPPSFFMLPSVKEQHWIHVSFQLPSQFAHYTRKAEDYISHLVGHEGRGSLLSALKERGWATELISGVSESGYDRNSNVFLFGVSITLTDQGLAEGFGMAAVGLLFQYLDLLAKTEPKEWVWDELKSIADLRFRFQEEDDAMDYVSGIAATMPLYSPEHALIGDVIHEHFDPPLIQELLTYMSPHRPGVRIELQTKSYDALRPQILAAAADPKHLLHCGTAEGAAAREAVEPWFNLPYVQVPLGPASLAFLATPPAPAAAPELSLPPRNEFIPTDFSLQCEGMAERGADPNGAPDLIHDGPGLRVWHKMDAKFKTPRSSAYFLLYAPGGYPASPRGAALTYLVAKLWEEHTCEMTYLADAAGLNCHIQSEGLAGLSLKLWGFSHKLPALTVRLFEALAGLAGAVEGGEGGMFERVKEAAVKKYKNHNLQPSKEATWTRLYAIRKAMWHVEAELQALEALTAADVVTFLREEVSAALHLEALLHGNIAAAEAGAMCSAVLQVLGKGAARLVPAAERAEDVVIQLPPSQAQVICLPTKNAEERNSAIENYYQLGQDVTALPRLRCLADLLEQIMYEPCFDELRTKQQLGYTVFCGMRVTQGAVGYAVHIVSSTRPPAYLDARIEEFLSTFTEHLRDMSDEEFAPNKEALIHAKMMKDRGLTDETDRHWYQITRRSYSFNARELEVAELSTVTKSELLDVFERTVAPTAHDRRKLSARVVGRQHWDDGLLWENEVVASGPEAVGAAPGPKDAKNGVKSPRGEPERKRAKRAKGKAAPMVEECRRRVEEVEAWKTEGAEWAGVTPLDPIS